MSLPTRLFSKQLQEVQHYIRRHEMVLGGESVLLAVSGGIDSMVMLDIMARLATLQRLKLAVAHFNHGLRGDASRDDAAFVMEQAKLRKLKVYIGQGDVAGTASRKKLSLEDAARGARYGFLERLARRHGFSVVMTAHTASDNAETVVMNLLRGSGVTGLAGIPPMRPLVKGVILARPLLSLERTAVESYAEEAGVEWREDETNKSTTFLRNRIRHELLPTLREYNPKIVDALNSTSEIMRGLDSFLKPQVLHAVERVVSSTSKNRVELSLHQLKHYAPVMQAEIVQRLVSDSFEVPPISYKSVERALALIWKESGSKAELGGGLCALRDRETVIIRTEFPTSEPYSETFAVGQNLRVGDRVLVSELVKREDVSFNRGGAMIEYVSADQLPKNLTLRSWREGDRFRPLGMDGEKKVSDFLIDRKVPLDKKREVLVVADNDTVVWVCGMRLDDRFKITDATKSVLKLQMVDRTKKKR